MKPVIFEIDFNGGLVNKSLVDNLIDFTFTKGDFKTLHQIPVEHVRPYLETNLYNSLYNEIVKLHNQERLISDLKHIKHELQLKNDNTPGLENILRATYNYFNDIYGVDSFEYEKVKDRIKIILTLNHRYLTDSFIGVRDEWDRVLHLLDDYKIFSAKIYNKEIHDSLAKNPKIPHFNDGKIWYTEAMQIDYRAVNVNTYPYRNTYNEYRSMIEMLHEMMLLDVESRLNMPCDTLTKDNWIVYLDYYKNTPHIVKYIINNQKSHIPKIIDTYKDIILYKKNNIVDFDISAFRVEKAVGSSEDTDEIKIFKQITLLGGLLFNNYSYNEIKSDPALSGMLEFEFVKLVNMSVENDLPYKDIYSRMTDYISGYLNGSIDHPIKPDILNFNQTIRNSNLILMALSDNNPGNLKFLMDNECVSEKSRVTLAENWVGKLSEINKQIYARKNNINILFANILINDFNNEQAGYLIGFGDLKTSALKEMSGSFKSNKSMPPEITAEVEKYIIKLELYNANISVGKKFKI